MSLYDVLVRNGSLVTADGVVQADLAVADGRIVAIAPALAGTSQIEINASGLHLLPGVIDAHVHFNEPGRSEWEGFACGTRALAAGGVTTFFDMPLNAHPPTTDAASFDLKCAAARQSALVDWALWGGLVPGNLGHLPELAERGVVGFKAFMSNSGIEDFSAADDLTLYEGMACAAQLGLPVAVHAENEQITGSLARRALHEGRSSVRDYLASRPVIAELEAISRAIGLAEETGCRLHIVHVSTGRGVQLVVTAQARGVDVSCETCPHYLVLTEDDVEQIGALAKCAPPLRSAAEQAALWAQLKAGRLPMVASDHSPAPAAMKTDRNFFNVWGGISGCQSTLPLLISEGVFKRDLALPTLARITSSYVAQRFGLAPRKGQLIEGADADFVLIDLARSSMLQAEDLFYRHQHSPYVGRTLRGQIVRTVVRGRTVYLEGKPVGAPAGQLIIPQRKLRVVPAQPVTG